MKNYSSITENKDITTKEYVDSNFMPFSGGTFTGNVTFALGQGHLKTDLIKSADDSKWIAEFTSSGLEIGGSGYALRFYSSTRPVVANQNKELAYTSDIPDISGKANLSGGNTFSGLQMVNAPANSSGTEQATAKFKTANGGSITFGKEGSNSGTMIRLDQTDGTCRLRFRSSSTAGAMVWEQPEQGANLYIDLGKSGADYHRITFPASAGTLALTSQIPTSSTVSGWGFTKNTGTVTSVAVKMNNETKGTVTSSGTIDLGTVITAHQDISGLMPKSGGTFTGEVKFGNTENFQGYYIKRMIGSLSAGTAYANLSSSYKDGTWHRMWRLRFPNGSSFWGKIKITLYGGYSSFNASGVMSKSITCNFNTSNIYNNVGCYDGLGVNVEQDFRISEAIWNATANAWEVLIWQKNLSGNNSPVIMLECWTTNNTNYINAFNGIAAQTVELTQSTSYSAQKASSTGGTKTVMWEALPVYENPLGEEIATVAMLEDKQDKITSSNKLSASLVSGLATVATTGSYTDLSNTPTILSEADVKGIKVNNATNADVAGEARKISNNMLFEGYKHLGNGAMSETTMKYNGSDIRKLYFGDEFQFLNADSTTTDDINKDHRLTLKPTGVAAGTYNSVTVDAKGRVIAGTNTPAVDTSNFAKLDTENTFTKGQVITGTTSDSYSVKASGYIKGSWLQSSVKSNYGSGTGMVCVFDGSGWIYYRTPSEILSEASGVPKSAFSLTGTTLTITI